MQLVNQGTGILQEQAQDKVILPLNSQRGTLTRTSFVL